MLNRTPGRGLKIEVLALHGGVPVRDRYLPYSHHTIDEEDIAAVGEALRSDWITQGPKIEEFERALADYCNARYGVAFSSGTAALHGACVAAGLAPTHEAITTPLTFAATANAIVYCGAKPVFADICPDTLNINPAEIERHITPLSKVIIIMDFAGHPADVDPILSLARKHNLTVIEDAAHALGAEYIGRKVGGLSDMTIFSFHPVKHITTGEGGMVLTNDFSLSEKLRMFRHHGIIKDGERLLRNDGAWYYEIHDLGHNFRITDFQCALGISQLRKLPGWLARRQAIARRYNDAFANLPAVEPLGVRPHVDHAYHLYVIQLDLAKLRVDRATVFAALRAEGIGVNVHYVPVHLHPYYRERFGAGPGLCPVAEAAYEQIMSLPIFPRMTDRDTEDVIKAVSKVVDVYGI